MQLSFAQGKYYGILGLGKSGRSVLASLTESRAEIVAWDDGEATRNVVQEQHPTLAIVSPLKWKWSKLEAMVISPGIPHTHAAVTLAKQHRVPIIGDVELLVRANRRAQVIAITGTNGKSTTTTLIGHILRSCGKRVEVGGNLGIPVLDLKPLGKDETYVLELSSYQLETVQSLRANIAVWLNISPDHLDHHGSMQAYIEAKQHIFDRQRPGDVAVVGIDDATSEAVSRGLAALHIQRVIPISGRQKIPHGVYVEDGVLQNTLAQQEQPAGAAAAGAENAKKIPPITGSLAEIKSLQGEHNWQNAAAAYAACLAHGCEHKKIIAAMQRYKGLPHRMQWLGEKRGITFVNDSKATNADAAEKSLRTYDAIYWIAGGVAKEGGIASLAPYFPKIRHAYLIGEAAEAFAETLKGRVLFTICETLDKAFKAAVSDAAKNKLDKPAVVLAPACASFDQFPNFEKRGEAFVKLVDRWKRPF